MQLNHLFSCLANQICVRQQHCKIHGNWLLLRCKVCHMFLCFWQFYWLLSNNNGINDLFLSSKCSLLHAFSKHAYDLWSTCVCHWITSVFTPGKFQSWFLDQVQFQLCVWARSPQGCHRFALCRFPISIPIIICLGLPFQSKHFFAANVPFLLILWI